VAERLGLDQPCHWRLGEPTLPDEVPTQLPAETPFEGERPPLGLWQMWSPAANPHAALRLYRQALRRHQRGE
jgi:hypothetical protein